jgi:transcriptional regulator with XRE-family HTH domain
MTTTAIDIGRRVREARERAGVSQAEIGRRMGWARQTVSQIELGVRSVLAQELDDLARALDAEVDELLGETQPR